MSKADVIPLPLVILAGGRATRLDPQRPKFLTRIDAQRCFADMQLGWAQAQGFRRVILSVGHLAEQIEAYCEKGERWGLEIEYVHDQPGPLGTGGAVRLIAAQLDVFAFALTYGDTLLTLNASALYTAFHRAQVSALMTYLPTPPGHTPNISEIEAGWIAYTKENPPADWPYIDYGFSWLKTDWASTWPESSPFDLSLPLARLSRQRGLAGVKMDHPFWEIGNPSSLQSFRDRYGIR